MLREAAPQHAAGDSGNNFSQKRADISRRIIVRENRSVTEQSPVGTVNS